MARNLCLYSNLGGSNRNRLRLHFGRVYLGLSAVCFKTRYLQNSLFGLRYKLSRSNNYGNYSHPAQKRLSILLISCSMTRLNGNSILRALLTSAESGKQQSSQLSSISSEPSGILYLLSRNLALFSPKLRRYSILGHWNLSRKTQTI